MAEEDHTKNYAKLANASRETGKLMQESEHSSPSRSGKARRELRTVAYNYGRESGDLKDISSEEELKDENAIEFAEALRREDYHATKELLEKNLDPILNAISASNLEGLIGAKPLADKAGSSYEDRSKEYRQLEASVNQSEAMRPYLDKLIEVADEEDKKILEVMDETALKYFLEPTAKLIAQKRREELAEKGYRLEDQKFFADLREKVIRSGLGGIRKEDLIESAEKIYKDQKDLFKGFQKEYQEELVNETRAALKKMITDGDTKEYDTAIDLIRGAIGDEFKPEKRAKEIIEYDTKDGREIHLAAA